MTAGAWTRAADQRIATKAARLAPRDLQMLIERFDAEYKEGLDRARADEGSESHRYLPLSRQGRLRERIERETGAIITMIRKGSPMEDVVERMGTLAHFVADANNPFHVAHDQRLGASRDDFEHFFERKLQKFPTVFYGLDSRFILSSYLDRTFSRSARLVPLIDEEYFRFGTRRTSSEFDDRSTAFGVASICYSRSVSDLVNLYFHIWGEAGGDVRSAPVMRGSNLLLNDAN